MRDNSIYKKQFSKVLKFYLSQNVSKLINEDIILINLSFIQINYL
jgi:hypothetical protein